MTSTATASSTLNPKMVSLLWATVDHAADLAQCHAKLFPDAWDENSFKQFLSHPGSITLIARQGNPQETIGFIVAQLAADEAEILTLGVIGEWQRHGIARRLLDGLQRAAVRGGATKLHLEVAEDNFPALVLYSRIGFTEAGRREAYYKRADGSQVGALKLTLALPPA